MELHFEPAFLDDLYIFAKKFKTLFIILCVI